MLSSNIIYAQVNCFGRGYTRFCYGKQATNHDAKEIRKLGDGSTNVVQGELDKGQNLGAAGRFAVVPFQGGWVREHGAMVVCEFNRVADDCDRKGLWLIWTVPLSDHGDRNAQVGLIKNCVQNNFTALEVAQAEIAQNPVALTTVACANLSRIIMETYNQPAPALAPPAPVERGKWYDGIVRLILGS